MTRARRIALVAVTAAGHRIVERIDAALAPRTTPLDRGSAAESLRAAFAEYDCVVAVLAIGAVVRILAPQIAAGAKHSDAGVIAVDEAGRFVTPVLGGHAADANHLALDIADVLGAEAVITTATDAVGLPGLDMLGWPAIGDVAGVSRRMLDGDPVVVAATERWPLPALGEHVTVAVGPEMPSDADVVVSDRLTTRAAVVLRPPSLVAGMGASRGVSVDEAHELLTSALAGAGLALDSLAAIATAEVKADEDGLIELAERLAIPLITHPAADLCDVPVPNPSEIVRAAVGVPSVAEAAARLGTRADATRLGELVVGKRASAMATVAVARHAPRGRLAIVGLGPGSPGLLTPTARDELRRAQVVVGLDQYVDQIRSLLRPGTEIVASGLGHEQQRAATARERARDGYAVALVGSGDAGVYAMASPALERADADIDVVGVPGITAALAAAAVLGAPLGHDHCYLSLSDLHTPWAVIERRVRAIAEADLVLVCYNPRSVARNWQLDRALELLSEHRSAATPVGVVRNASRPDETSWLGTLADLDTSVVDMYCLVVVGSTQTAIVGGRMVTPRGYRWQRDVQAGRR